MLETTTVGALEAIEHLTQGNKMSLEIEWKAVDLGNGNTRVFRYRVPDPEVQGQQTPEEQALTIQFDRIAKLEAKVSELEGDIAGLQSAYDSAASLADDLQEALNERDD